VGHSRIALAPDVEIENVGGDYVALVRSRSEVLTLTGDTAHILRAVLASEPVDKSDPTVSDLVARGVLQRPTLVSRRSLVKVGLVGAGAGVVALSMPSVAVASSDGDDDMVIDPNSEFSVPSYGVRVLTGGTPSVVQEVFIVVVRSLNGTSEPLGLRSGQTGTVQAKDNRFSFVVTFDTTPIAPGQIDAAPAAPDGAFRSTNISGLGLDFNDPFDAFLRFTVGGALFQVDLDD
jgi:hypothetical protein